MNREILFRGKCVPDSKYAGEWVTGGYVAPDADCKKRNEGLIVKYFGGNTTITYHVDPDTVGQFTGLTDKNNKKIYEGDVVDMSPRYSQPHRIEYSCGQWICVDGGGRWVTLMEDEQLGDEMNGVEVIGNIHDNSELLSTK